MNCEFEARKRTARLGEASRKESMRVNAEFAAIEGEPDGEQESDPLRVVTFKNRMRGTRIGRPAK